MEQKEQIEVWHPVRRCAACKETTDDQDQTRCEVCQVEFQLSWEWKHVFGTLVLRVVSSTSTDKWIFLDEALFVESRFSFPRRLLFLQEGGKVYHVGQLEEEHPLEEYLFWIDKSDKLKKVELSSPNFVTDCKWRKSNKTTFHEDAGRGTDCAICGDPMPFGEKAHQKENTHMKEIVPGLFLGTQWNAMCSRELKYFGIQAVLNCAQEIGSSLNRTRFKPYYRKLEWEDSHDQNITLELESARQWIDSQLQEKKHKVLVHCALGRSRSVAVVIYYLVKNHHQKSYEEALQLVRKHKPFAQPNPSFEQQIKTLLILKK